MNLPERHVSSLDLLEADVLLYRGTGTVPRLIRLFDRTDVNHAGLYRSDGTVAEAVAQGLVRRGLKQSEAEHEWIQIMRLSQRPVDMMPVAASSDRYLAEPGRYGYEQLLLLAFLSVARRLPVTPTLSALLRTVLDSAASVLTRLTSDGREPLICSEFVYRCYDEAAGPFELRIDNSRSRGTGARTERGARRRGTGVEPGSLLSLSAGQRIPLTLHGGDAPADGIIDDLGARYLSEVEAGSRRGVGMPVKAVAPALGRFAFALADSSRIGSTDRKGIKRGKLTDLSAIGVATKVVEDFVTPGDLLFSPDLGKIGRITRRLDQNGE